MCWRRGGRSRGQRALGTGVSERQGAGRATEDKSEKRRMGQELKAMQDRKKAFLKNIYLFFWGDWNMFCRLRVEESSKERGLS